MIGLHLRLARREAKVIIGDRDAGHMIAPATLDVCHRLLAAAAYGVSTDVDWDRVGNAATARLTGRTWDC